MQWNSRKFYTLRDKPLKEATDENHTHLDSLQDIWPPWCLDRNNTSADYPTKRRNTTLHLIGLSTVSRNLDWREEKISHLAWQTSNRQAIRQSVWGLNTWTDKPQNVRPVDREGNPQNVNLVETRRKFHTWPNKPAGAKSVRRRGEFHTCQATERLVREKRKISHLT